MASYVPLTEDELTALCEPLDNSIDLERALREVIWLRSNIRHFLNQFAAKAPCKGCGEEIYWMPREGKRPIPYTKLGLNHFGACKQAEQFRSAG